MKTLAIVTYLAISGILNLILPGDPFGPESAHTSTQESSASFLTSESSVPEAESVVSVAGTSTLSPAMLSNGEALPVKKSVKISSGSLLNTGTTTGTVIGYIWEVKEGSPKFASVRLPIWGFTDFEKYEYDIYIFEAGKFVFYRKAGALTDEIEFPEGGITRFKVLGIDPKLGICATDRNVTWGLKFSGTGIFNGGRTPITDNVPNQTCIDQEVEAERKAAERALLFPPPKRLDIPPSGFLIPTSSSIPQGFIGEPIYYENAYDAKYYNNTDRNRVGLPAIISISEEEETSASTYENYLDDLKKLHSVQYKKIKEFTYLRLPGVVIDLTSSLDNIGDHRLILKDGNRILQISIIDGSKTHFLAEDLILMLKTFTRQP